MVGTNYNTTPVAKIVNRGEPIYLAEKTLTAVAKAGMLAVVDGNDYKAKPSDGVTLPVGWVGYEHTDLKVRPVWYETPYRIGDPVMIMAGGNFQIYALVVGKSDADVTINSGDLLADAGNGLLRKFDDTTDKIPVGRAVETVTIAMATTPKVVRMSVLSLI